MFQMLGAGDKAGSGIDKIRASWAEAHWQSPVLRESHRPDRVVLELLTAFRRAGASGVLTYHAPHAARLLNG